MDESIIHFMRTEKPLPDLGLILLSMVFLALSLVGCTNAADDMAAPTDTPIPLTAYQSATPTPLLAEDNAIVGTATPAPTATATPFLYAIESGDTLLEVAHRYSITLEQLLAANPGIDPSFLIVGTEIIIPTGDSVLSGYPSPTPINFDVGQPQCYPAADGGLWCLVVARNSQAQALENLSAAITLYATNGEKIAQQLAISALNILQPGQQITLATFFATTIPAGVTAQAELRSALPVDAASQRYIDIQIQINNITIDNTQAHIQGIIRVPGGEAAPEANRIWLLANAYDADGNPVGVRKWEVNASTAPGTELPFEIIVYSLQHAISEVQILGEARPAEK